MRCDIGITKLQLAEINSKGKYNIIGQKKNPGIHTGTVLLFHQKMSYILYANGLLKAIHCYFLIFHYNSISNSNRISNSQNQF